MLPHLVTSIPGPRSRALAERLRRYESRNVTYLAEDFPVFWERAEGVNVWDAIIRAKRYFNEPPIWQALMQRAMTCDFSWEKAVPAYEGVYRKVGGK